MSERGLVRRATDARPGRTAVVITDLDELRGPTAGVVTLPNRLFWQDHRFDLDHPSELIWMYENVLRESVRLDELRTWLDGPTLVRVWPQLFVPRAVRTAWETRHTGLRDAAVLVGAAILIG